MVLKRTPEPSPFIPMPARATGMDEFDIGKFAASIALRSATVRAIGAHLYPNFFSGNPIALCWESGARGCYRSAVASGHHRAMTLPNTSGLWKRRPPFFLNILSTWNVRGTE
jgi:hypothetical protein